MSRLAAGIAAAVLSFAAVAGAQQAAPERPTPRPAAPAKPAAEEPETKAPPRAAPAEVGQPVNVRVELTITDQTGGGDPVKKTVSMIIADRTNNSIRSAGNSERAYLNVDAAPSLMPNGNIKLAVALEYNPRQAGAGAPPAGSALTQRVTAILEPGKPLILSQAADPLSDRKISVEVRAATVK